MYRLYLDSSGSILTVIVTKNNQILNSYSKHAFQKQTELAVKTIDKLLKKSNLSLKEIKEIIVTNGPGSYTGIRVGLTFVKTLLVLNPDVEVFVLNTLLLQAGLKKVVSIIKGYNDIYYLAVYDQGKEIITTQQVSEAAKNGIIRDLKEYDIVENFSKVDIINNFLLLTKKAKKINKIQELDPIYIGDNFVK